MTMYTIAGKSVTEEEFRRAAKVCIGTPLDETVVSTVFHIFDVDGEMCGTVTLTHTHTHTHKCTHTHTHTQSHTHTHTHITHTHTHTHTPGDGKLSHREFLAVMKNWKLRGFKVS